MRAASGGSATVVPGDHSSVRGQPSASIRCSSAVRRPDRPRSRPRGRSRDRSPIARSSCLPAALVARSSTCRCGHGASGLTWSGVTGETPPQSLMPASTSRRSAPGLRLGGAWMFIVRREDQSRHRDGPKMLLDRRRGRPRPCGFRLGPEVLHDDFLDMSMGVVRARAAPAAPRSASHRVSPMPMRMPVVKGTRCSPPCGWSRAAPAGSLVRRTMMRPSRSAQAADAALQHHALRDRDFRAALQDRAHRAGPD